MNGYEKDLATEGRIEELVGDLFKNLSVEQIVALLQGESHLAKTVAETLVRAGFVESNVAKAEVYEDLSRQMKTYPFAEEFAPVRQHLSYEYAKRATAYKNSSSN